MSPEREPQKQTEPTIAQLRQQMASALDYVPSPRAMLIGAACLFLAGVAVGVILTIWLSR